MCVYVRKPPTDSVQEQLGFGGEVVVDDVVQQGDVDTASSHVRHKQHHRSPVHKLPDVDLPGGLIQRAVDVGALDAFRRQKLEIKTNEKSQK